LRASNIAGVERASRFEQQNVNFAVRNRAVHHPARHDHKLALADLQRFFRASIVPVIHSKAAQHNQEQLVFVFVMMPDKLALELD
jgi:hypothetical protein